MLRIIIVLSFLIIATQAMAETKSRCDCSLKKRDTACQSAISMSRNLLTITSTSQMCSQVVWYAGSQPHVTIVTDGKKTEEWSGPSGLKMFVDSCQVCADKLSGNTDSGKCETSYTDNFGDSGIYKGDCNNGVPNGHGIVNYHKGDRFEGEFSNGKRNGQGKLVWANGGRYEGDFLNDERTGRGTYVWADGDQYEGEWFNGAITGKGKLIWANGGQYEGDFLNDEITGKGKKVWANGDRYEGDFLNGKRNGKGSYWNASTGVIYTGEWRDDMERN